MHETIIDTRGMGMFGLNLRRLARKSDRLFSYPITAILTGENEFPAGKFSPLSDLISHADAMTEKDNLTESEFVNYLNFKRTMAQKIKIALSWH